LDYHILESGALGSPEATAIPPKLRGTFNPLYAYQGMNQR